MHDIALANQIIELVKAHDGLKRHELINKALSLPGFEFLEGYPDGLRGFLRLMISEGKLAEMKYGSHGSFLYVKDGQ